MVSVLADGRLGVYPAIVSDCYEFIYRAASGVYWDKSLGCFHSTVPKDWDYKRWYRQILFAVKGELGVELHITVQTTFESTEGNFKEDITAENKVTHCLFVELDETLERHRISEDWIERDKVTRISNEASQAFHSKQYTLAIELLSPYQDSPYFNKKSRVLLRLAKKYA